MTPAIPSRVEEKVILLRVIIDIPQTKEQGYPYSGTAINRPPFAESGPSTAPQKKFGVISTKEVVADVKK